MIERLGSGPLADEIKRMNVPLVPVVRANGFLFVSGLPAFDQNANKLCLGNVEEQTRVCMDNLQRALEDAGSSLEKIVKCTVMATNPAHYHRINEVYGSYFKNGLYPARTFLAVSGWAVPFDVEIEAIALA
jgi:2-iminobutanoate/2-iminopropanoate deaminase